MQSALLAREEVETPPSTRAGVSVCVGPKGDAAVFVTRPAAEMPRRFDVARLATEFAARGLRLLGVSTSAQDAPAACPERTRSGEVSSDSIVDAVLALVDRRAPVLA